MMEGHLMSRMNDTIAQLGVLANEWANINHVPEVDWTRIRSLEFQDRLTRRNTRLKRLEGPACVLCKEFEPHVCLPHSSIYQRYISLRLVQNLTYRACPTRQYCGSQTGDFGSKP